MSRRDKQFSGFARAVMQKLDIGLENDLTQRILARAAYDLVEHAIETADYSGIAGYIRGENIPLYHKIVQSIPDMPTLPEEKDE